MYGELGERKSITNKDEVTDRGGRGTGSITQ